MFFTKITKKTINKEKMELKSDLIFWNKFYGFLEENVTHKLDYIPENWIVTQFSALQIYQIYDTQGLVEFAYMDTNKISLQIKQMQLDYKRLPLLERTLDIANREYYRVNLLKRSKSKKICKHLFFKLQPPSYHVFFATNLVFIKRKIVRLRKKKKVY